MNLDLDLNAATALLMPSASFLFASLRSLYPETTTNQWRLAGRRAQVHVESTLANGTWCWTGSRSLPFFLCWQQASNPTHPARPISTMLKFFMLTFFSLPALKLFELSYDANAKFTVNHSSLWSFLWQHGDKLETIVAFCKARLQHSFNVPWRDGLRIDRPLLRGMYRLVSSGLLPAEAAHLQDLSSSAAGKLHLSLASAHSNLKAISSAEGIHGTLIVCRGTSSYSWTVTQTSRSRRRSENLGKRVEQWRSFMGSVNRTTFPALERVEFCALPWPVQLCVKVLISGPIVLTCRSQS